jgi:BMFP domain-containing protein YqiC
MIRMWQTYHREEFDVVTSAAARVRGRLRRCGDSIWEDEGLILT